MMVCFPHSRLIARLRAIASLTDDDAARIEKLPMHVQNLPAAYEIVQEEQTLNECCMLVDGYLHRHKIGADGKRQIVSWHVPGDELLAPAGQELRAQADTPLQLRAG